MLFRPIRIRSRRFKSSRKGPGQTGAIPGLPPGWTGEQVAGGEHVNDEEELYVLKSPAAVMWPGALVAGATIADSSITAVRGLMRAPASIRLVTSFVARPGRPDRNVNQSRHLTTFDENTVTNAQRELLTAVDPVDLVHLPIPPQRMQRLCARLWSSLGSPTSRVATTVLTLTRLLRLRSREIPLFRKVLSAVLSGRLCPRRYPTPSLLRCRRDPRRHQGRFGPETLFST